MPTSASTTGDDDTIVLANRGAYVMVVGRSVGDMSIMNLRSHVIDLRNLVLPVVELVL